MLLAGHDQRSRSKIGRFLTGWPEWWIHKNWIIILAKITVRTSKKRHPKMVNQNTQGGFIMKQKHIKCLLGAALISTFAGLGSLPVQGFETIQLKDKKNAEAVEELKGIQEEGNGAEQKSLDDAAQAENEAAQENGNGAAQAEQGTKKGQAGNGAEAGQSEQGADNGKAGNGAEAKQA
jgi:hypothetical protein